MTRVKTKYYAFLREVTGKAEEEIVLKDGATLMDFIKRVVENYGSELAKYILNEDGSLRQSIAIAVNGEKVDRESMDKLALKDGDTVVIIPPISGGSPPQSPQFL